MRKDINGFISIFLALIILPVYSFAIVTVDAIKIGVAKNHLLLANENLKADLEASFERDLYDEYKIQAIGKPGKDLEDTARFHLKNNIDSNYSTFYKAELKDFRLIREDEDSIVNVDNLEKQIIEQMEIEAPYHLLTGILDLVNLTQNSKSYSKVLENKLDYQEEYSKINQGFESIYEELIAYDEYSKYINENSFNINSRLKELKDEANKYNLNQYPKPIVLDEDLTSDQINNMAMGIFNKSFVDSLFKIRTDFSEKKADQVLKTFTPIKNDFQKMIYLKDKWNIDDSFIYNNKEYRLKNLLVEVVNLLRSDRESKVEKLKTGLSDYNSKNRDLLETLEKSAGQYDQMIKEFQTISKSLEDSDKLLKVWGDSIKDLDPSEVKSNFQTEYNTVNLEFTKDNVDSLLNKLLEHKNTIRDIIGEFTKEKEKFNLSLDDLASLDSNFNLEKLRKLPSLGNYKIYKYVKENLIQGESGEDKKTARETIKNLEEVLVEKSKVDSNNNQSVYNYLDKELEGYLLTFKENEELGSLSPGRLSNYKNLIARARDILDFDASKIKDNLLIALYLGEYFENKLAGDQDFSSQIEYILFGNETIDKNENSVANTILGIRFLLNSIYAYTNADLAREATVLAAAVAGWTGFGMPLVKSLILTGMSFGESLIDINTLNKNGPVASFKNRASWTLSSTGLSRLAKEGIADLTSQSIDNIYEIIEMEANQGIDQVNARLEEYINQTLDGISQTINARILSPVQTSLTNSIDQGKEVAKTNLDQTFDQISKNLSKDSDLVNKVQMQVLQMAKSRAYQIVDQIEGPQINAIFEDLNNEAQKLIKSYTSEINRDLKREIGLALESSKLESKELVNKSIDKYLSHLGRGNENDFSTKSGLGFKYKDYLTLVSLIRLSSGHKPSILSRMLLVMDSQMRQKNPDFRLVDLSTSLTLETKISINTNLIKKYIFVDDIENVMEVKY